MRYSRARSAGIFTLALLAASCAHYRANAGAVPSSSDAAAVHRIGDELVAQFSDSSGNLGWGYVTPERRRTIRDREDRWASELSHIDREALFGTGSAPALEWRMYGTVREAVESSRALRVCRPELWYVDQLNGWQVQMENAASALPVNTADQRRALIASFRTLPQVASLAIADLREGVRLGYTAPRANVERVIAELDAMLADSSAQSALRAPLSRDASAAFRSEWLAVLAHDALPALHEYRDYLKGTYLSVARGAVSLAALPNGSACYRAQLRAMTTMDVAPESLYAEAIRELPAIHERIRSIGQRVFGTSDVVAIMRRARTDSALVLKNPDTVLAAYAALIARARAPLSRWFNPFPDESLVVTAVPRAQAPSFPPARYQPSPPDRSAPAQLVVNAYQPGGVAKMNVAMGVIHEGYPGHHWQFLAARAASKGSHPVLTNSFNAGYVEGWAIYAEVLADEMGLYQTDLEKLGYLIHQVDVFSALEIDAGLHGLGWTRAQAIDTMMQVAGRPSGQAQSYADRHAATPGQLASYGVGYLAISQLRREAEARLGSRFDIKAFHSVILEGPLPLAMLRMRVERWIAAVAPAKTETSSGAAHH
jgi:uncharacterized protein (DUF885 family)